MPRPVGVQSAGVIVTHCQPTESPKGFSSELMASTGCFRPIGSTSADTWVDSRVQSASLGWQFVPPTLLLTSGLATCQWQVTPVSRLSPVISKWLNETFSYQQGDPFSTHPGQSKNRLQKEFSSIQKRLYCRGYDSWCLLLMISLEWNSSHIHRIELFLHSGKLWIKLRTANFVKLQSFS